MVLLGCGPFCPSLDAATQKTGAAPVVLTEADWLGRSRDDVVATLGKPLSALQRGDTEVLMYAKNVRIEIRDDEVVSYRAGSGPAIVASDGTRYNATDRGRVQRIAPDPAAEWKEEFAEENDDGDDDDLTAPPVVDAPRAAPAVRTAVAPAKETTPPPVKMAPLAPEGSETVSSEEEDEDMLFADGDADAKDVDESAGDPALEEDFTHPISEAIEDLSERGMMPGAGEEEETPVGARALGGVVYALLRFGFAVLMLRIAISWVELPCYMPDVCKVAALYVIVREGMRGLANFGGHWEWITLFRLDDVVSFLAMAVLLFKFKIALSGLTALKIAIASVGVTYFLMLIVGVAVSFTLA